MPQSGSHRVHMEQVEKHARYRRVVGNRTTEDTDIDEADFPTVAGRVDGCEEQSCVSTMDTCRAMSGESRFTKQVRQKRHKCRMAAIEVVANTKISRSVIGRSRRSWRYSVLLESRSRNQGVYQSNGHWMGLAGVIGAEGSNLRVSHRAEEIKCVKDRVRMASPAENWSR